VARPAAAARIPALHADPQLSGGCSERRHWRLGCALPQLEPVDLGEAGGAVSAIGAAAPLSTPRAALAAMRGHPLGRDAALVGEVREQPVAMVFLRTDIGGTRVLDMLVGDPLPRIC
jgi:hydrogenase expression/formation protein HypE